MSRIRASLPPEVYSVAIFSSGQRILGSKRKVLWNTYGRKKKKKKLYNELVKPRT